jgi:uncharacterized protein involved in exopolysaccharide biosynthesis
VNDYRNEFTGQGEREAEVEFNFMHLLHRMNLSLSALPIFLVIGLICAVLVFAVSTKKYTAMMTVEQSQTDPSQLGSAASGSGSGLLSMALPLLAGNSNNNFSTYQYLLTSRNVADKLFRNPNILAGAFQNKYDFEKHAFVRPSNPIEWAREIWRLMQGQPAWRPKTADDLLDYINKYISVDLDKEHSVVEVTFQHEDRGFAVYFLSQLSAAADGELRDGDKVTAQHQIVYLGKALNGVSSADVRDSMIMTLSSLQKQLMFTETAQYYAFEMVNRPEASTDTATPSLPLYMFLAVLLSGLVWMALAYRYEMQFRSFVLFARGGHRPELNWKLHSDRRIGS